MFWSTSRCPVCCDSNLTGLVIWLVSGCVQMEKVTLPKKKTSKNLKNMFIKFIMDG